MINIADLRKSYEEMFEERILSMAEDEYFSLIPEARKILEAELVRRGISWNKPEKSSLSSEGEIRGSNQRWLSLIIGLLVLDILLFNLLPETPAYNLDGTLASSEEVQEASLTALLISFPLLSAILVLFLALIPFKGLTYKRKYPRVLRVILVVVYGGVFISSLIKIILYHTV